MDGLQRLASAQPCSFEVDDECDQLAVWAYNGYAMCRLHLRGMADMNSDNAAEVAQAVTDDFNGVTSYAERYAYLKNQDHAAIDRCPASWFGGEEQ